MHRQHQNYGATSSTREIDFVGSISTEFNSLCDSIVTNIYTINSSVKTLENSLKQIGTNADNQGLRHKIHVVQLSTNQIASVATKDLSKLKLLVTKSEKQRLLQVEKLEENFKEAVNRYYTLQKDVANKQKSHILPPSASYEPSSPDPESSEEQQKQVQMANELRFEQDMLLEREAKIKQVESDILDINQIMRELGSMVHAQGETIDTIENSIDHAVGNVEEGAEQLIKASRYQNRYRRKVVYLALIGLIIAAILIGILVSSFKK